MSVHGDPVAPLVLALGLLLLVARIGGAAAIQLGQPAVLGELVAGIALGNLGLIGIHVFDPLRTDTTLALFAGLGVLILLFEVGLESTVAQMMKVGASSLVVAVLGVIAPLLLGWGVGAWLLPEAGVYVHAFLGATLSATSVGITARVLQDLGRSRGVEARIILGAAVIDDVLGLVILAAITGTIVAAGTGQPPSLGAIAWIGGKAALFLGVALAAGVFMAPRVLTAAATLRTRGVLLTTGLSFCFFLAWAADRIGLAPIVGAFAAGLVLEEAHYRDFVSKGERPLEELVRPISDFLAPIFFVSMGLRTDLHAIADSGALSLAIALTLAAIIGKQVCGLGVLTRGTNRLAIGVGMMPRGEVGLIFANIGAGLRLGGAPIVDAKAFSAVVLMVIITTLLTPPALRWALSRTPPADPSPSAILMER